MNEERAELIRRAASEVTDLCLQLQHKEFQPLGGGSCSCFAKLLHERKVKAEGTGASLRLCPSHVQAPHD